jgi:hypothetical protein
MFDFSVLPGRVARLEAELRMENLTLKGFFVRYISHEIRYSVTCCAISQEKIILDNMD